MSMTQIIWFNLLLCVILAYNKTFSPLNPTHIHYPGYNPDVTLNLPHTSDILDNNLETLPDHNDHTYNSDREQVTIIANDEQSQEVTDGFVYNIEWENTDRELLGITVDKDLFPELICNLLPLNSDTNTHNIGGELPGTNEEQNRERPRAGGIARIKNRGEYRKRNKPRDEHFIYKRKRPNCGRTFNHSSLASHKEIHQCENCNKSFSTKSNLNRHMSGCFKSEFMNVLMSDVLCARAVSTNIRTQECARRTIYLRM
ncbi:hypothetical protein LOAG_14808 [Loa loa]|uniref:C2H2-type domain-containing protein n=1 Tax=Loa loa TaxID=7209 RepID=A0A1S0TH63_LOALO|nr:hypothetical protein LOAG_14808 [Loa loa]EFO13720.1 hypothetical protein LOAG_14808 [Loa loa]